MATLQQIPTAPNDAPPQTRQTLQAVINVLNQLTANGGAVTQADLVNAGVLTTGGTKAGTKKAAVPLGIKGLVVRGGFGAILLTWDAITQDGFSYVEVWRSLTNDISTAVMVGTSSSTMYSDVPPDSKTSVTYYYWIRAVNVDGVAGPYNAVNGTPGSTANDPAYVLGMLTGQITSSQLHADLSAPIGLIPAIDVNLADSILSNAVTHYQGQTAANGNIAAIQTAVEAQATDKAALSRQITTLQATVGTNTAAIQTIQTTQASDTAALSQQINTVQATANSNTASIQTEQTARINGDQANASQITTLQTAVNGNTASIQQQLTSINGLQAEYTLKTDVNGKIAGFGLANGGPNATSLFEVVADRFAIAPPVGSSATALAPFVVDATKNMVLMDGASIIDATITNAHIKFVNGDTINAAISLTAPVISGGTLKLGQATSLDVGKGFYADGTGVFRAGNALGAGDSIRWDGSNLSITGKVTAAASSSMPYSAVTGGPPANADSTITTINGGVVSTGFINLTGTGQKFQVRGKQLVSGVTIATGATRTYTYWASGPSQLIITAKVNIGITGGNGGMQFLIDGVVVDTAIFQNATGTSIAATATCFGGKTTTTNGQAVALEARAIVGGVYYYYSDVAFTVTEILL